MSMMSRAATEPQNAGSLVRISRRIAGFARALMLHWSRRQAVKMLSELDDRALRDIGLLRCHIEAAARGSTAVRPTSSR
jgi:uncharacterized protein YjiS (DUF1127 family)